MAKKVARKLTVSPAVASVIKVAKAAGATHLDVDKNNKRVRMYVGDKENRKTCLSIRGLSSENPTVKIKPALRGTTWKAFFHGKLQEKNFTPLMSCYVYKGERTKLLSRVKIAVRLIAEDHKAS